MTDMDTIRPPRRRRITDEDLCQLGRDVIEVEAASIRALRQRIDHHFAQACRLLLDCRGRVIVTGMGKSGHIGGKIAATLASTGTPAFFVHPGEASHGDLGMITTSDAVVALSKSGETREITILLPLIKRLDVPLVALTGRSGSIIARAATVHLDISVAEEACPLGLAPTSSTTATLAMGDALAIALLEARGFTREDFARSHPGGALGRRLLLRIEDVMHVGERIPQVTPQTLLSHALVEMTNKGLGMTAVIDAEGHVLGIFTDGDLRRALDHQVDVHATRMAEIMTPGGRTIQAHSLAAEALQLMERYKINALLVVDSEDRLIGALNMHDLLQAGVV